MKVTTNTYLIVSLIPLLLVFIILLLKYSKYGFYFLFGLQFVVIFLTQFVISFPIGLITYILSAFITVIVLLYNFLYDRVIHWKDCSTPLLWSLIIWGVFCNLEVINPNTVVYAWNVTIAQYVAYPIVCAILVPITVKDSKGINTLLIIWSTFVILSALTAMRQQYFGFNTNERYFLNVLGGAKTHIIWSGIRYFSCFTDAANFGAHMAMALTTFAIALFYVRNHFLKFYLFIATILATYGLAVSGTRSAIAIPLGGIIIFAFLSHNLKAMLISFSSLVLIFILFAFTNIGNGNTYIRKMRSAFHPSDDPSYVVRLENRQKMKALMSRKPFGYGLGLSKPTGYHPKESMPYPPDSALVSIWVETGVVGFTIYVIIHLFLFVWASFILFFKVKNNRVRGLIVAWLCMSFGFFITAYANDVFQYPNVFVVYTGLALCFAAPLISEKEDMKEKELSVINNKTSKNG